MTQPDMNSYQDYASAITAGDEPRGTCDPELIALFEGLDSPDGRLILGILAAIAVSGYSIVRVER